jgi:diguanylate cyclase (GGDEF)-like protein/PAS domain S-box-containing protein
MASVSEPDPLTDEFYFRALMDTTSDSIYFKDRECRLRRVSMRMATSLGFAHPGELIGKTDSDLFGEAFGLRTHLDDSRIMESDQPIIGLVESRQMPNGELNWSLTSKLPLHDASGAVVGLMGITREINELKQAELNLQHLATHDMLTGLPNRYLMTDRLDRILVQAERSQSLVALLFVDVDDFKVINDTYGHDSGDELLRAVAQRLTRSVRASDTVCRIGGDEFVIVLETLSQAEHASIVATNVQRSLAKPFSIRRHRLKITVSIGISLFPQDGADTEMLLRAADYAMYLAKRAGKNRWALAMLGGPPAGSPHAG